MTEGYNSGKHQNISEEISSFLMIDQNFDKKSNNRCRAYSTLLGGTLYMIVLGSQYILGSISPYIQSYYGVEAKQTQMILPALIVVNSCFIPLGAQLTQLLDPKLQIGIGSFSGLSMILLAISQTKFWPFCMLFVFGFGSMCGLTYMVPVHHGWLWFPERAGLVSGIIIGGFGLGPLIFNNLSLAIINPDNVSIDENGRFPNQINDKFTEMITTVWLCWVCLVGISILLIFSGEEDEGSLWQIVKSWCFHQKENADLNAGNLDNLRNESDEEESEPLQEPGTDNNIISKKERSSQRRRQEKQEHSPVELDFTLHSFTEAADHSYLEMNERLTSVQRTKLRIQRDFMLFKMCLRTDQFWTIYLMATLSILFGYYQNDISFLQAYLFDHMTRVPVWSSTIKVSLIVI